MSGVKERTITMTESQVRTLRQQAAQATSLQEQNRILQQLADMNAQRMTDQEARISTLNNNIRTLRSALQNVANDDAAARRQLQAQLRDAIRQTNAALEDMARQNEENLARLGDDFRDQLSAHQADTLNRLEANRQALQEALSEATAALQADIHNVRDRVNALDSTVNGMAVSNETLLNHARQFADTARQVLEGTAGGYRVELLVPGRMAAVQGLLDTAVSDIALTNAHSTNASAARLSARTALQEALQLQQAVIEAEQQWQTAFREARQALTNAQGCRRDNEKLPITQDYALDVDFWCNGGLTTLDGRLTSLDRQLDNARGLSSSQLQGIRQAAEQIGTEIRENSEFAMLAYASSLDREDVAHICAAHMLERLALVTEFEGYEGSDQRAGHRIILRNPRTGFEMVVDQSPQVNADGTLSNRLESHILSYGTNNEEEGDRIAYSALEGLAAYGFSATPVRTRPGMEKTPSQNLGLLDHVNYIRKAPDAARIPSKPEKAPAAVTAAAN